MGVIQASSERSKLWGDPAAQDEAPHSPGRSGPAWLGPDLVKTPGHSVSLQGVLSPSVQKGCPGLHTLERFLSERHGVEVSQGDRVPFSGQNLPQALYSTKG